MRYEMHLTADNFEKIKAGTKIIEVRLNDKKRREIKIGDRIVFTKRPDNIEAVETEVVDLKVYMTFAELYSLNDKVAVGSFPGDTTETQIEQTMKYYSPEEEAKYGVLAIHLRLV